MDKQRNLALLEEARRLFNEGKNEECILLITNALFDQGIGIRLLAYLGAAYANLKKYDYALAAFGNYLRYNSNDVEMLTNLGAICHELDNNYFIDLLYAKALTIDPDYPMLNKNLAIYHFEHGNMDQALYYYSKAVTLDNSDANHLSYAHALLCNNNFAEGWREYEYRKSTLIYNQPVEFKAPSWNGEDLNGKTLYVYTEQGVGDCIQFIRFLPLLKEKYNVTVLFVCSNELWRLFGCVPGIDAFVYDLKMLKEHDYYVQLCSLPFFLQIHNVNQLRPEPYLQIDPAINLLWQNRIPKTDKIKIGICWSGNPNFPKNKRRSCQLKDFLFLLIHPHIAFFSLQKVVTPDELQMLTIAGIPNLGPEFNDFADTGAAIEQMDLIISVDTSISHLAGALGKPTWLLLSYYNEWRFPITRETSPWYTSINYIRQTQAGDWRSVFAKVNEMLKALILHQSK